MTAPTGPSGPQGSDSAGGGDGTRGEGGEPGLFPAPMSRWGSAALSEDGAYRYLLRRGWDPDRPTVGWLMLNPSTADQIDDDPTIRRVLAFSHRWSAGGVLVANLYGLRATDPRELDTAPDPVGPQNDDAVRELAGLTVVVCAWGNHAPRRTGASGEATHPTRVRVVTELLGEGRAQLRCLGTNRDGSPRHPLYLRSDTELEPWPPQPSARSEARVPRGRPSRGARP